MSTSDRFRELILKGPIIRCSFSGQLFNRIDMHSNGVGGFIANRFRIKNPYQMSDYRQGYGWQRGYRNG